ncbi:unnamed protein product [Amoebophrya sp. A120]|nr:unnamed protein product [Amoebophrya sp. A120]|eukprot:GSA120T00013907001.1
MMAPAMSMMRLSVLATTVSGLRLEYGEQQQKQRLILKKKAAEFDFAKFNAEHQMATIRLDPTENEHPNPFFVKDWWPHPENPNKKTDENPENAETQETEEANAEAANEDSLSVQAKYQAEASKNAADKDALDKEKKKKAEEEAKKAEEAVKAAEAAKKKAEETKKSAMKALEENHKAKIAELNGFKQKELAKCRTDFEGAKKQWQSDRQWFVNTRRAAAHHFRSEVRRAPWFKRVFVYARKLGEFRRKLHQTSRQFRPKVQNWHKAIRAFHKCRAQQRQFDWAIRQAKAKYEQARGTPETNLVGCFEDKPARAMMGIRGRFSVKKCARKCGRRNKEFMAIQYGHQCFCGNGKQHERYGKKPDGDCSKPCEMDPNDRVSRESEQKLCHAWTGLTEIFWHARHP